jgi:DNA primase
MSDRFYEAASRINKRPRTNVFKAVRDAIDPADYYHDRLPGMPVPKPGVCAWCCGGCCPFHDDRRPGNFRIHLQSGAFTCFSCGAKGGDVIAFEAKLTHASPIQAARALAERWRVDA